MNRKTLLKKLPLLTVFAASLMSHEIRTSMNGILSMARLLADFYHNIHVKGVRMLEFEAVDRAVKKLVMNLILVRYANGYD